MSISFSFLPFLDDEGFSFFVEPNGGRPACEGRYAGNSKNTAGVRKVSIKKTAILVPFPMKGLYE
jgi:hypothetical protein